MTEQVFTFEKLGITSKDWDFKYTDNNCGYSFSTPSDGILLLKSIGKMRPNVVKKQLHFIENYHIQLNSQIANYKSVLVWDVSEVYNIFSLNLICKELGKLSVDVTLIIPGKLSFKLFLSYWTRNTDVFVNLLPDNLNDALAFARRIKSPQEGQDIFKGKFAEYWSIDKKTKKIGRRVYRYLELPEWQYANEDETFNVRVAFFDNRAILYEMNGRIGALEVQTMQQKVVTISNQLEIDLKKIGFYVIFDTRKVSALDPKARKLMRKMEQHQHHLSNGVVVLANPLVKYLLRFRRSLHPERYDHWRTAKSISDAFSLIELKKINDVDLKFFPNIKAQPASDYDELLKQFKSLQADFNVLSNNYKKSMFNVRKVLSYVNAGDFLMTPFRPKYDDETIEGEVYNSFAILHNDLKRNRSYNVPGNVEIGAGYSNIEYILKNISVPAFVYSNKKILFVNSLLADLLGANINDLKDQPLGSFVHTYELNRIERYFEEVSSNTSFECDIYNGQNRTITVTMSSEFLLIDGIYAQLIFIETKAKSINDRRHKTMHNKVATDQKATANTLNRTTAGVINFYLVNLKTINNKLLNQYISPESYNPHEGARVLTYLSGYVQKIFEGATFYQTDPNSIQLFSFRESIEGIAIIFSDYIKLTKPYLKFNLTGNIPSQSIGTPLQSFWLEALLIRILHLLTDVSEGQYIDLSCRQKDDNNIEIEISDDGANLNLFSLDKVVDSNKGA
ncbi:MAG: hypothetical protein C0599_12785, partial [Salinivirgaceae bacterium]